MNDSNARVIKAPTGTSLQAKSWLTEAPLRMIMNNLDPEVAERPEDLVVYGGIGKAARNWECFDAIVESLRELEEDETLLVQSGKPVGVFRTHSDAPRVLIANSNLVPAAGSWIYIGSQGIVQGTYETFAEMGRQHYGGDLSGKWILTAGLGGMGGAQPLAATMAGASMLAIECQSDRIEKRLETGYLDRRADTLDDAMAIIDKSVVDRQPVSVGLLGNAAELLPEMLDRGIRPDALTDQTSAHDPANGYLPIGWSVEQWLPSLRPPSSRWLCMSKRCWSSMRWACRPSTTATTFARLPWTKACGTHSTSPASCRPMSARSSVGASALFAGWHCPAIRKTSTERTRRSWS